MQEALQIEPDDLQRHACFIQPAFVLDDLRKSGNVPRAFTRRETALDGRTPEPHDGFHGFHVLGTDLDAEITADAIPHAVGLVEHEQALALAGVRFPWIFQKPVGLGQRRRPQEALRDFVRRAGGDAGAAHDAGIDVVKIVRARHERRLCAFVVRHAIRRARQPRLHRPNLVPEGCHVDDQVLDHGKIAEGLDGDIAVALQFLPHGGAAGQLFVAVDGHRAGAANGRAARIAKRQRAVLFVLDANQAVQDRGPPSNLQTIVLVVRMGVDFGIEAPDGKG